MAVIWQKTVAGKTYEVRAAGNSRRLYTDGVFHSQYNPAHHLTGNVWDLISLPAFFMSPEQIRRVLVLGVGGGAVMQQFARWFPQAQLIGIELDRLHIQIAREHFQLIGDNIELIHGDAIDWVRRYRGLPFDLVIDDLFAEQQGEPQRVIEANHRWTSELAGLLTKHGTLVMNFTESCSLRDSYLLSRDSLPYGFVQAYRLMTPLYDNQIGVFLRETAKTNEWRQRIQAVKGLAREFEEKRAKYQLRKLAG